MEGNRLLKFLGMFAGAAGVGLPSWYAIPPSLVVRVYHRVGCETLRLARDLIKLPETIKVRGESTLAECLEALRSGEAAVACMTLDEMLRARAEGLPLSAALVLDISAGADAVLARSDITHLSDLANKRIGFDPNTVGSLVFEKLLEAAGLPPSAAVQLELPPDRQLDAWRRNEVDVVITYEPWVTDLLGEGAHVLLDSRQMPDMLIDVLAVRSDRSDVLPLAKALVASHFLALDYMWSHEEDALQRIAKRQGLRPDEAQRMLRGVMFLPLAANREYLVGNNPRLKEAAQALSTLMVKNGLLAREDSFEKLILPDLLPSAG